MQWREALRLMQTSTISLRNTLCMTRIRAMSPPVGARNESADANGAASSCSWAACLAEHHWPLDGGDVIALSSTVSVWGRTALYGAASACGELSRMPAPGRLASGGACWWRLAAKQPWRNLLAQCLRFVPGGRITLKRQVCNSKTGACWRGH